MKINIILNINDKLINFGKKICNWKNAGFGIALIFFIGGLFIFSEDLSKPHDLHQGDIISASELNENFDTLYERKLESLSDVETDGREAGKILKWDGTQWYMANDIGEGTGSPWNQAGADIYYNNGNVGIGTATPGETL